MRTWLPGVNSTNCHGPVPTVLSCCGAASAFSDGTITTGTLNELICNRNVGCAFFMRMTKVPASGASQPATLPNIERRMPILL